MINMLFANTNQLRSDYFDGFVMTTQTHAEAQFVPWYEFERQLVKLVLAIVLYIPQGLCFGVPRNINNIPLGE